MRIAGVFIYMFLMLWGSPAGLLAASGPKNSGYSSAPKITQPVNAASASCWQQQGIGKKSHLPKEDKVLLYYDDDDDDDDSSNLSQKTFGPLVGLFALNNLQPILHYRCLCAKTLAFCWMPVSPRYILQRALLI